MSSIQLQKIEKTAKSVDEAVSGALVELGVARDMVDVEIIDEGSKGLFGILGGKDAKVVVTLKYSPESAAKAFLDELFFGMGINVGVNTSLDGDKLSIDLEGEDMGIVIGKRGETLDSIQYLTSLVVNRAKESYVKVTIDSENYREKRKEALENLARRIIDKVVKSGRRYIFEPMNPYERRVIHAYIQNDDKVHTYSIGEEPNRKVVVAIQNTGSSGNSGKQGYR